MAIVVLFHAGFALFGGALFALSMFFTLSGFLVGSILIGETGGGGRFHLGRFFDRRLRRLLPAGLLGVVLCLVVGLIVGAPSDPSSLRWQAVSSATFWTNWQFIAAGRNYGDLFSSPSPFDHFWSLAMEAQFYVAAPLVLVLVRRARRARWAVSIVLGLALASTATSIVLFTPGVDNGRVYYGTDARIAEFLIGFAAALVLTGWRLRRWAPPPRWLIGLIGSAALVTAVSLTMIGSLSDSWVYQGGFALNATLTSIVILAAVWGAPVLTQVLSFRPLTWLGEVSYGLYLYHWPIFVLITPRRLGWGVWPTLAVRLAVTFVLVMLSLRFVEKPLRRAVTVAPKPWHRIALGSLVVVIIASVLVPLGLDTTVPAATAEARGPALVPSAPADAAQTPEDTTFHVAVVGDADGVGFGNELKSWAAADGRFEVSAVESWACAEDCRPWAERWPEVVEKSSTDLLVLAVSAADQAALQSGLGLSGPPDPAALREGLASTIAAVTALGVPVVWMNVPDRSGNDLVRRAQPDNAMLYDALAAVTGNSSDARQLSLETQYNDLRRESGPSANFLGAIAGLAGPRIAAVAQSLTPGVPRVLVIGDSVARSLGAGLEEWGSSNRAASVWDVSRDGCGLLLDGDIQGLYAGLGPLPPDCAVAAGRWSQQISDFRPDVVLVLSTIWDLADRKLPSWRSTQRPGDQQFDSYAIDTYGSFADMVTKADPSARIAWLNVPCVDATHGGLPFGTPKTRTAFEAGRRNHVNTVVLPAVASTRPAMRVVDFAGEVCPGGKFSERLGDVADARPDGLHFSQAGAVWASQQFAAGWLAP